MEESGSHKLGNMREPVLLVVLIAALLPNRAGADVLLRLQDAPPAEVSRAATSALGLPVEIRGGAGRRITVTIAATNAARLAAELAVALGGSWRATLRVRTGGDTRSWLPPDYDRQLNLGIQDLLAERAFGLVARELKVDLDLSGPLPARVSLLAVNLPAAEVLDRLAFQAGVRWSLAYVITAPDAPAVPAPAPMPMMPAPGPAPAVLPPARPEEPPSGPELRTLVHEALGRVLRARPELRGEAVREFVASLAPVLAAIGGLPPGEREGRLNWLRVPLSFWRRFERGLAPEVRKQLAPVTDQLEGSTGLRR